MVALHMHWRAPQRVQDVLCVFCVRNEFAVLDVRLAFADQPSLVIPRTAAAFARHPLNAALLAHVVRTECHELLLRPDLNVIVLALSGRAGFARPLPSGWARA